jgi:Outer membrane protein beta-barrel domain
MMRLNRWLIPVLLSLSAASGALAQKVEVTPFVALPFGGQLEHGRRGDVLSFDVDDGTGYGLGLGFALTRALQLELFWSHQESDLVEDGGFLVGGVALTELGIDYLHAGLLYQWGGGQFHPFIAGSLGVTEFDPGDPLLDSETRFSFGVGFGAKVFFNKNFGLRVEARGFTTWIDEGDENCHRGSCYYDQGTYFLQGELRGGLILAF